jgi:hypothetical protein
MNRWCAFIGPGADAFVIANLLANTSRDGSILRNTPGRRGGNLSGVRLAATIAELLGRADMQSSAFSPL